MSRLPTPTFDRKNCGASGFVRGLRGAASVFFAGISSSPRSLVGLLREERQPVANQLQALLLDPVDAAPALPLAKLQGLSGTFAGRELSLTKTLTTLGRRGVQVAAITRRAEGYYIVHVESGKTEGLPLVNGMTIGAQARKLQDNDVIQLAGVKMGFFLS